jgi:hypothetical protein
LIGEFLIGEFLIDKTSDRPMENRPFLARASTHSMMPSFQFRDVLVSRQPYPHFEAANCLEAGIAESLLAWLSEEAPWQPRKLQGYDGYADISLQIAGLPPRLKFLLAPETLSHLRMSMGSFLRTEAEGYVKVTAHRLVAGSSLKPHCDLAPLRFTHRLLVQLNRGWTRENGGLLCLFHGDPSVEKNTKQKLILPVNGSAFAFEVSRRSFHAVTPVVAGERYTLSYTFYPPSAK